MNQYQFKDILFMRKKKSLTVENEAGSQVGMIALADITDCEKGHAFSYTSETGTSIEMGIIKRGIKDLLTANYIVKTGTKTFTLNDRPGNSLLYFCVDGTISGQSIRIEENWSKTLEIKVDKKLGATVKQNELTLKTTIEIDASIPEDSVLFGVIILSLFFYKIYNDEAEFIENIIFDS